MEPDDPEVVIVARETHGPPARNRFGSMRRSVEFAGPVMMAIVVVFLGQTFVVKPYRVPTGSMIPTLRIGQRILVNRLETNPGLGDVVVFHPPEGALLGEYGVCGNKYEGYGHKRACDQDAGAESSATFVKRVVGLPGDHLRITDGKVIRNGVEERGSYLQPCYLGPGVCDFPAELTVPKGDYYMMGDNRGVSADSRFWGPIPEKWIIGVVVMSYWPLDRFGFL